MPFRDNEKAMITILLGSDQTETKSNGVLFGEKVGRVQALMLKNSLLEFGMRGSFIFVLEIWALTLMTSPSKTLKITVMCGFGTSPSTVFIYEDAFEICLDIV